MRLGLGRGSRLVCRLGLRCFLGRCGVGRVTGVVVGIADLSQLATDLDGVVFLGHYLRQNTSDGRWNFGIDLVGRYFEQGFVDLDGVALLLEPPGDSSLGDALTKSWHLDGEGHVC